MAATQSLNFYNIAQRYFKNESYSAAFIKEIELVVNSKFETKSDILATKQDAADTKQAIIESKFDLLK